MLCRGHGGGGSTFRALGDKSFGFGFGVESPMSGAFDSVNLGVGCRPVGINTWDAADLDGVVFSFASLVLGGNRGGVALAGGEGRGLGKGSKGLN